MGEEYACVGNQGERKDQETENALHQFVAASFLLTRSVYALCLAAYVVFPTFVFVVLIITFSKTECVSIRWTFSSAPDVPRDGLQRLSAGREGRLFLPSYPRGLWPGALHFIAYSHCFACFSMRLSCSLMSLRLRSYISLLMASICISRPDLHAAHLLAASESMRWTSRLNTL